MRFLLGIDTIFGVLKNVFYTVWCIVTFFNVIKTLTAVFTDLPSVEEHRKSKDSRIRIIVQILEAPIFS